jgi:hypothetical protein
VKDRVFLAVLALHRNFRFSDSRIQERLIV